MFKVLHITNRTLSVSAAELARHRQLAAMKARTCRRHTETACGLAEGQREQRKNEADFRIRHSGKEEGPLLAR